MDIARTQASVPQRNNDQCKCIKNSGGEDMIHWNRTVIPTAFTRLPTRARTLECLEGWLALSTQERQRTAIPTLSRFDTRLEKLLRTAFHNKCVYCETPLHNERAHITNYRPRWRNQQAVGTPPDPYRYFWLMWEWTNLHLLCRTCNRNKDTLFPIDEYKGGRRARIGESDPHLLCWERPLLLDPGMDNPNHHLRFDEEGGVEGITERGRITVTLLGLNDWDSPRSRCQLRKEEAHQLRAQFSHACQLTLAHAAPVTLQREVDNLLDACAQSAPFAGMKRQLLTRWLDPWLAEYSSAPIINDDWTQLQKTLRMWMTIPEHSVNDEPQRTLQEDRPRVVILKRSSHKTYTAPKTVTNRWAFLVGINEYSCEHIPPLRGCHNDVYQLARQLRALGYHVVELIDGLPHEGQFVTRALIEEKLQQLCAAIPEDALLFTHFSCHGERDGNMRYLIMPDTRNEDLATTALPLSVVTDLMAKSSARQLLLTLDACRIGMSVRGDRERQNFVENAYELASGFAILAASTADQWAFEEENGMLNNNNTLEPIHQHPSNQEATEQSQIGGLFSHYLIQGLQGMGRAKTHDNIVTVDSLKDFILDRLRSWQERNPHHPRQEPTVRIEGMGSIIVADYRCAK